MFRRRLVWCVLGEEGGELRQQSCFLLPLLAPRALRCRDPQPRELAGEGVKSVQDWGGRGGNVSQGEGGGGGRGGQLPPGPVSQGEEGEGGGGDWWSRWGALREDPRVKVALFAPVPGKESNRTKGNILLRTYMCHYHVSVWSVVSYFVILCHIVRLFVQHCLFSCEPTPPPFICFHALLNFLNLWQDHLITPYVCLFSNIKRSCSVFF